MGRVCLLVFAVLAISCCALSDSGNYDSVTVTLPTAKPKKMRHHKTTLSSTTTSLPITKARTLAADIPLSSSAAPSHSSFSCAKLEPGVYPSAEGACENFFYVCEPEADYALEFYCASLDTYFDVTSGFCLEKAHVSACGGIATTTAKPLFISSEIPFAFDCAHMDDGDYAHDNECSQLFVSCSGGMAVYRSCPADTFFDTHSSECHERHWVQACGGESTTRLPETTVAADTSFDCSSHADGFYPSADCASIFYACSGGVTRGMKCADSTVFDKETGLCMEREWVESCPGGIATTIAPFVPAVTGPAPFVFDCAGRADGEYANPQEHCSSLFVSCSGGQSLPIYRQCPAETKYDELSGTCLHDSWVLACGGEATTILPETTLAPETGFDCSAKADGYYSSGTCSPVFYSCSGGHARAMKCAGHASRMLKFDIESQMCMLERYVPACGGKATTTTTTLSPISKSDLPKISCKNKAPGVYEDPTATRTATGGVCSSLYIVCLPDAVEAIVNVCPHGTKYDITVDQCQYDFNVTACGKTEKIRGGHKLNSAPALLFLDESSKGAATEASYTTAKPLRTTRYMKSTTALADETIATSELPPATEAAYTTAASTAKVTRRRFTTSITTELAPVTEAAYTTAASKTTRRRYTKPSTVATTLADETTATSKLPPATEAAYTTASSMVTRRRYTKPTTKATTLAATEAAYTSKKTRPTRSTTESSTTTTTMAADVPSTITAGY
jgi:hypothetical protein